MATFDDEFLTPLNLEELKEFVATQHLSLVIKKIKECLRQQDLVELHIGVTGETSSGKSSFVNAFRGLGDEDEGSAKTGVMETTMKPEVYLHPKYNNVKLWDLPGIETPDFKAEEYFAKVEFERYDFFIIISSDRFKECHATLAKNIASMGKKFYFVRSKIDTNISAEKNFDPKKKLDSIRSDCENGLRKAGIEDPVVFLISRFEFGKYDFDRLERRMEEELPEHKRRVLMLALPNITKEVNAKKRVAFEKDIVMIALLAACVATVPIPGLAFAVDMAIIMRELKRYYSAFDLDDQSLQLLSDRTGKTVEELKSLMKSPLRDGINRDTVAILLSNSAVAMSLTALEYAVKFIPLIGSLTAGGVSFYTVTKMLKKALNDVAEDADYVLTVLLDTHVQG